MNNEKNVEKRLYPRLKRNLPIEVDFGCKVLETKDISLSGIYFEVDKEIPLMTKVSVTLMLPFSENEKKVEKTIECKGIVVRSEPHISKDEIPCYDIAIFFNEISEKSKATIASFIEVFKSELN